MTKNTDFLKKFKIKEGGIYKTHPLQEYILEEYKNNKQLSIVWRTCPVQQTSIGEDAKHIGEFWYVLRWTDQDPITGFTVIKKSKIFYFKTLKDLKRAINKEFKDHGYGIHYKVR